MGTVIVAGLLSLFGTAFGAALTTWTVRRTNDRSERLAREAVRRQEYRSAVIGLASSILAYRQAEVEHWHAQHGGSWSKRKSEAEISRTRTLAWNAFYELQLSTNSSDIIDAAQRAVDSARRIREVDSEDEVGRFSSQTRNNVAAMVECARNTQAWVMDTGSQPSSRPMESQH